MSEFVSIPGHERYEVNARGIVRERVTRQCLIAQRDSSGRRYVVLDGEQVWIDEAVAATQPREPEYVLERAEASTPRRRRSRLAERGA